MEKGDEVPEGFAVNVDYGNDMTEMGPFSNLGIGNNYPTRKQ